jgi:hypothetical protein
MAKSVQKITLSQSRDIPFNKLVLSQSNVRRIKAGVSIRELAQDIARRTLLQSLTVRPVVDGDGNETGMFEIPAGGRRYRALGGVDSKDSLLEANQIQDFFWGGSLGCDGTVGFERRGVGTDGAADHRPT